MTDIKSYCGIPITTQPMLSIEELTAAIDALDKTITLPADLVEAYVQAVRVLERRVAGASDGDQIAAESAALAAVKAAS